MKTLKFISKLFTGLGFFLISFSVHAQKIMPTPQSQNQGLKDFMDVPAVLANYFGNKKSNYKEETVFNIDESFKAYTQDQQQFYTIQKILDFTSGTKPEKLVAITIFTRDDDFNSSPAEKKKINVQNSHASGPSLQYGIYRSDGKYWFLVKKSSKKFNDDHENFGSYGYPEDIDIISYGKGHYALVENTGDYAQGIAVQGINYLDVFSEKKVLGLSAETSGYTINGKNDFSFDYTATPIPSDNEYYDLAVKFSGTHLDSSRKKVIPYNKTVIYVFDTVKGKYILKE